MRGIPPVPPSRGVALAVLWSACFLHAPAASAQVVELHPDEMLRFERAAGTVTELAFDVAADQFVHVEVRQGGVDVAATVIDPTGIVVREADEGFEGVVMETISWTRSRPGRYVLRVRAKSALAGGFFDVLLERPRPSTDSDEEWIRSERTLLEVVSHSQAGQDAWKSNTRVLRRLLEVWRALGDERWAALTQMYLGATYHDGNAERGLDDCLEAADYAERSGDLTAEWAFSCTAAHLKSLGYLEDGILVLEELLARQEEAGDAMGVRFSHLNLGLHLLDVGRTSEAAAHLAQALQTAEESGDLLVQAYAHSHLGRLHADRGEYQQALDEYGRALAIPHPYSSIRPVHRAALASVQLAVGDLTEALTSAQRAVAEARQLSGSPGESIARQTLGRVHLERGEVAQAIALLSDTVGFCRRKSMVLDEVGALVALGRAEAAQGRRSVARRHQQEALAQSRTHHYPTGEARALAALCALDDAEGVSGKVCEDALAQSEAIAYRPVALLSRYYLARGARRRGELEQARTQLEEALKAVDGQRLELRRSDLRQAFSATVDDIEDEYVDVLADLASTDPAGGWDTRAFEASERSRARSLRDELAESRLGIRQGADPALLREEADLRDRLRASLARQLNGGNSAGAARELERTISVLQASLGDLAARIQQTSPRYAALSRLQPPGLEEIRSALLDDDTVLLYYALGERRSFLWVVTRDALERHVLPARPALERLARASAIQLARGPEGTPAASLARLSRLLLAPAGPRLKASHVVVVADGALHYVPFAALADPQGSGPLARRAEVVHLPSASAGVMLARMEAPRWTKTVAVFADPIFRRDDDRVRMPGTPVATAELRPVSLPRELGAGGLLRLPFTRREARAIESVAGPDARIALDFDASREAALAPDLASFRFVHFATHGLLNASRPELSGIVLSMVDSAGRPQNGFLTSLDTYNLRLDADLVVLSGCRTALGKDVRSEGIVGLTRGFMYAGARGVLAALWPVDDLATSELMRVFYEGLLGPRRLSPPAALREAQAHVRSRRAWSSPYYWAAFQLQGVWRGDPPQSAEGGPGSQRSTVER
jgi:CHAT domain-containing protein